MNCEYVKDYYQVPARIGRRVEVNGKAGIIAKDRGNHIGVNFDEDKPGHILSCHPTWKVKYLDMGVVRKPTKSQERYQRYLEFGDGFDNFIAYCQWDATRDWSR